LSAAGWDVDVTGRYPASMPEELIRVGVRFHRIERREVDAIGALVGAGADLLVDAVAYCDRDVRTLLPVMASIRSLVLISTRAVYVDSRGRHVNGGEPPHFAVPISEDAPTVAPAPDGTDPFTRDGYAPSKIAAEMVALDSGLPVTVIRPSKVHGRWARNPRTRPFVERMLRGDRVIALADGDSVDHLTAAENAAALIETVAHSPGRRILNSADPDTPTAAQIVRMIVERLDWQGDLELLAGGSGSGSGNHPWQSDHPIMLDTAAAARLGYVPEGSVADLLPSEIDWVASQSNS
jgi:nucleoside-diphosphate-sugar epimerase